MVEKIRNKMKETKGFTLVELIVVLVILAILAALLVPALTGYIDRANEQKIVAETRQVVMAAQTIASENYAASKTTTKDADGAAIIALAEVKKGTLEALTVDASGTVTTLTWKNGKTCVYKLSPGEGEETYNVSNSSN